MDEYDNSQKGIVSARRAPCSVTCRSAMIRDKTTCAPICRCKVRHPGYARKQSLPERRTSRPVTRSSSSTYWPIPSPFVAGFHGKRKRYRRKEKQSTELTALRDTTSCSTIEWSLTYHTTPFDFGQTIKSRNCLPDNESEIPHGTKNRTNVHMADEDVSGRCRRWSWGEERLGLRNWRVGHVVRDRRRSRAFGTVVSLMVFTRQSGASVCRCNVGGRMVEESGEGQVDSRRV